MITKTKGGKAMWMALIFSLAAGLETDGCLEVVSERGDTALGYYYQLPACGEIPRTEWLARFALANNIPNTDRAFRRLPAKAVWKLPVALSPVGIEEMLEPMPPLKLKSAPSETSSESRSTVRSETTEVATIKIDEIQSPITIALTEETVSTLVAGLKTDLPTEPKTSLLIPVLLALTSVLAMLVINYWFAASQRRQELRIARDDNRHLRAEQEELKNQKAELQVAAITLESEKDELVAERDDLIKLRDQIGYWYELPEGFAGLNGESEIFLKYAGQDQHLKKVGERRVYLENCGDAIATQVHKVEKHLRADPQNYGLMLLVGSVSTAKEEELLLATMS